MDENELPDNLKQAMESYANAKRAMDADNKIADLSEIRDELLRQANDVDLQIEKIAHKYAKQLDEFENYIKAQVFEIGSTVEYAGVKASHRSGYERVSWNNKKMSSILLSNPNLAPIFAPARKVTEVDPSVTVNYVGQPESVQYSREDYEASKQAEVET